MLSPTVFIMVIDDISWELHKKVNEVKSGYGKLKMIKLAECTFAYHLMISAENEEKINKCKVVGERINIT